jgi:hypothetical protein
VGKAGGRDATSHLDALRALVLAAPSGAPGPFALSADGTLDRLVDEALLRPLHNGEVECPFVYDDLDTALRALLSSGGATRAIEHAGEPAVREALLPALLPYVRRDGVVRMRNRFRYVVAGA